MRLTPEMLRTMIMQEMRNIQNKNVVQEGTYERPIKLTTESLNRIIREEYEAHSSQQELTKSR